MSVIPSSSRWKRKQRRRKISTSWRAPPIMSQERVPPSSLHLTGCGWMVFREGAVYVYCTGHRGWLTAHVTALSALPSSIPVTASLPPLEWPLSHQSGAYELRIEVQPKPHHRAHYETEGSRGAVKAPTGGHPVVQVWTRVPFLPCPRGPLGRSLLRSFCLVLIRLRRVSQLPIPRRDGKSRIECRPLIKPLRGQEKSLPELDKDRSDIHALSSPSLSDWETTVVWWRCLDWRFLKLSFCV